MKIAFTGNMMSGKSEAMKLFKDLSFEEKRLPVSIKFAEPLYEAQRIFQKEGEETKNRPFLQELSDVAKKRFGKDILIKVFIRKIKLYESKFDTLLCDDVRTVSEVETIKNLGFYLIGIKSSPNIRKSRNPNLFSGISHYTETMISYIIDNFCDIVLENNSSLDSFKKSLEQIYYEFLKSNVNRP